MKLSNACKINRRQQIEIIVGAAVVVLIIGSVILYSFFTRQIYSETVLFATDGNSHYRIPCIAVSKDGKYIAAASKRTGLNDWDKSISLVCRTSGDGITWSEEKTLVENKGLTNNNPVLIADDDGCFHFVYCVEYGLENQGGGVYYMKSEDNGQTWTQPRDISENTLKEYRNTFATGPGHGICLSDGTLLIPIWMVPKKYGEDIQSHHPAVVSTLYSKDHGSTWNVGEIIEGSEDGVLDPNEGTLIELADGSVMLNVRNVNEEKYRAYSISPDGISGWSQLEYNQSLRDPVCFGSIARYDDSTILFSNCYSQTERKNNAISISYDDGKTFPKLRIIRYDIGGYSDICVDTRRNICTAIEWPNDDGYYSISLYRFNMNWLLRK